MQKSVKVTFGKGDSRITLPIPTACEQYAELADMVEHRGQDWVVDKGNAALSNTYANGVRARLVEVLTPLVLARIPADQLAKKLTKAKTIAKLVGETATVEEIRKACEEFGELIA